jgi:hypothetical protein
MKLFAILLAVLIIATVGLRSYSAGSEKLYPSNPTAVPYPTETPIPCSTQLYEWNQRFFPLFYSLREYVEGVKQGKYLLLSNEAFVYFADIRGFYAPQCSSLAVTIHEEFNVALTQYVDWENANKKNKKDQDIALEIFINQYESIAKNYRNYLIANQGGLYLREITDVTESKETLTINLTPTQSGTTLKATAIPTKAVDACKPQLARFVSSVSKMVSVSSSLLNNMSSYADYGSKTSFSSSFVERTFSGLNGISVPTCADQPTEIVYSLGLIRDTMFPAYIEMEMGGAMSASRSDVGRWRDEVNGLLNDVKRLMGQIE